MEFKNLLWKVEDNILTLTINRESKLNALNIDTISEIDQAFKLIYDDDDVKGVIITGAGSKAFIAGADISEIADLNEINARKFAENGQEVFAKIENCSKPVIAAVNGFALGGGCELAMACHLRVAGENARFGQPEVNLGLIPGYGGTQRLTMLIGKGKALELMMTGDLIDAEAANRIGLVNHVVSSVELMDKAREIMKKIMGKAPIAISHVIDSVNAVYGPTDGFQAEANAFANCCKSEDFKEGTKAFLEKRKPQFKGE